MKKAFCFMLILAISAAIGCTSKRSIKEHINQMAEKYPEYFVEDANGAFISFGDKGSYSVNIEGRQRVVTPTDSLKQIIVNQLKEHNISYTIIRQDMFDDWEIVWDNELYLPIIKN